MVDLDFKGTDTQAQIKLGNGQFYGINYLQSVTNTLSLGGEGFWLGGQKKSGVGFAARYADDKTVATGQVATTGLVSLTYTTKVSEKAMLASDFMWNCNARQAQASVGYDYILRQSRLRGRIDDPPGRFQHSSKSASTQDSHYAFLQRSIMRIRITNLVSV